MKIKLKIRDDYVEKIRKGDLVRCVERDLPNSDEDAGAGYQSGLVFTVTEIMEYTEKESGPVKYIYFGGLYGNGVYSDYVIKCKDFS
jgi:hypothetical protein